MTTAKDNDAQNKEEECQKSWEQKKSAKNSCTSSPRRFLRDSKNFIIPEDKLFQHR
jgi:hypothetical protein